MEKETLSEKIEESPTFGSGIYQYMLYVKDVKQSIKEILEEINDKIKLHSKDINDFDKGAITAYNWISIKIKEKAGGELLK